MLNYVRLLLGCWINRNCNKLSLAMFLDSSNIAKHILFCKFFEIEAPLSFICKKWLCVEGGWSGWVGCYDQLCCPASPKLLLGLDLGLGCDNSDISYKFAFKILEYLVDLVNKPIKNWRYVLLDPGRSVYMYLILGSSRIHFKILIDSWVTK